MIPDLGELPIAWVLDLTLREVLPNVLECMVQESVCGGGKKKGAFWRGGVRYCPNSGQTRARLDCPLSANKRHCGQEFMKTGISATIGR